MEKFIYDFFNEYIEVIEKSRDDLKDKIIELTSIFDLTFKKGNKIIVFGNGGCAGIAQQMQGAFIGRFKSGKGAKAVLSLSSDAALLTTLSNDYGFENIYRKQLEGLMENGDVVIGITTSGNSENVVNAIAYAKVNGAYTIGFTGESGGKLKAICDFMIRVPTTQPSYIEEVISSINAIVCKLLD